MRRNHLFLLKYSVKPVGCHTALALSECLEKKITSNSDKIGEVSGNLHKFHLLSTCFVCDLFIIFFIFLCIIWYLISGLHLIITRYKKYKLNSDCLLLWSDLREPYLYIHVADLTLTQEVCAMACYGRVNSTSTCLDNLREESINLLKINIFYHLSFHLGH